MSGTSTPFHVGLTPTLVVGAAIDLTRESHLMTWSIRDLATRLGVSPSVIYHHVGGKDVLCRRVVEHVLELIEPPSINLEWQEWFRSLLYSLAPLFGTYPGSAKWMLMHGPTTPAILPTLEAGMTKLRDAGFGERTPSAYALLLNNAMLTISMSDDRLQHEDDGPRDHATMMDEFHRISSASEELRRIGDDFLRPFAEGGEPARQLRLDYYRFVVDTTIAGLEARLGSGSR